MTLQERIDAFDKVSGELKSIADGKASTEKGRRLAELAANFKPFNAWFTERMIMHRIGVLADGMKKDVITEWTRRYTFSNHSPNVVAVILAGNIPLAGADDLLAILINGDTFLGKLSSDDTKLFPAFCELICEVEPRFREQIGFAEGKFSGMNAVIATGSNNSGKYFDFYFSKYPHIIRRNRNGVAILDGTESDDELKKLGDDIFMYFGAGCRSVSKLYVPAGYDFDRFFRNVIHWWDELNVNNRYMNNYDYNKTIYLLNNHKLLDNNFLLLKEDIGLASPPGVLYYERYTSKEELELKLRTDKELMQCVVGHDGLVEETIPFGTTQYTRPWDYSDRKDTLEFLQQLQK